MLSHTEKFLGLAGGRFSLCAHTRLRAGFKRFVGFALELSFSSYWA